MIVNPAFSFKISRKSKKSRARTGQIITPHGIIKTPAFVPVGTNAAIKGIDALDCDNLPLQLIFSNTYHLMIQPGTQTIQSLGGIHKFMKRTGPIITDSGGFQVFSLMYGGYTEELKSKGNKRETSSVLKINEEGVLFRSYKDGAKILLTPEKSIQAQKEIGADIILVFDELLPYHTDEATLKKSLERTHRWELRSLIAHQKNPSNQALYGIIHGGTDNELRKKSINFLKNYPFDGFAIGGSVGKNSDEMFTMLKELSTHIPEELPTHLLGIADPPSIIEIVKQGIDTFDSSYPSKCARHGLIFTNTGRIKIREARYAQSPEPLELDCLCRTCQHFSRGYIHHLFKAHELSALSLASTHNLWYMERYVERIREKIENDEL